MQSTIIAAALLACSIPGGKVFAVDWEHQNMSWVLGPDSMSIRSPYGPPQPTGLTWSIVPGGVADKTNISRLTKDITDLGGVGLETFADYQAVLGDVIDEWTSVSGIINLGYVSEDGSVLIGGISSITDRGAAAGVGHIRFMAFERSDLNDSWAYASATYIPEPGTGVDNTSNHSRAGDVRFRSDSTIWGQGDEMLHFRNIAIHEVGHVLGFGHNSVSGSVMSPPYTEWNLGAGDIDGAIAIYGPIPEPSTVVSLGLVSLSLLKRRRSA